MPKNFISFWFVLLTGLSFSLIILAARIFFPEKLVEIVYFQSVVVFFTFIVQLGLRAGGRIHIHLGKIKTIDHVSSYIARNCWKLGGLSSLLVVSLNLSFYPSFILLQAVLSYFQGLYIARKDRKMVVYNSLLIILSIYIAGGLIIFNESAKLYILQIEILSLLLLLGLSFSKVKKYRIEREKKLFIFLINKYRGIQYSSYIIYATAFLFAQIFILLGKNNQDIISLYADVILVSGLQLMVISKLLVFYEGDIIKNKSYRKYINFYLAWCILSSMLLSFIYSYIVNPNYLYIFCLLSIASLSKLAFSFCSQFANSGARKYIYIIGIIPVIVYSALFIGLNFNHAIISMTYLSLLIFCFSGFSMSLILLILEKYRQKSIFI